MSPSVVLNLSLAWAMATAGPAAELEPGERPSTPPGDYWAPGERPQPEPPDGYWKIVTGSILLPLGVLGTAAAAGAAYATHPSRCERITDGRLSAEQCRGWYTFSWVRLGYSSLVLISGSVILGIGLHQRRKHREWKNNRMFSVWPWFAPALDGHRRGERGASAGIAVGARF